MNASLQFDMSDEHDACLDAVQAARWKQLVFEIEQLLAIFEAGETSPEGQKICHALLEFVRHERALAGLTFHSTKELQKYGEEKRAHWAEIRNSREKGTASPEILASGPGCRREPN